MKVWDVTSGECLQTLRGHSDWVKSVSFSPDGTKVASGSATVKLWDVTSGACLKTLEGHSNWVTSVSFSPDGTIVASGSRDRTAKLWDIASGKCELTVGEFIVPQYRSVYVSFLGNRLFILTSDTLILMFLIQRSWFELLQSKKSTTHTSTQVVEVITCPKSVYFCSQEQSQTQTSPQAHTIKFYTLHNQRMRTISSYMIPKIKHIYHAVSVVKA